MTSIQANREKASLEHQDRVSAQAETRKDNRARRENDRRATHVKEREYELKAAMQPWEQQKSLSQTVSGYAKSFKDMASGVGSAASVARSANDWAWYFKDAQRMSDVTSLPMFMPYGEVFDFANSDVHESVITDSAAPGILAIQTAQTIGFARGADSPMQRAAESFFDFVNERTGRNDSYEAADLMMLALAFASLDSFSAHLKRAYKCISHTSPENDYLPRHLIKLMGFDYDDLVANKIKFRDLINYIEDMKFKYLSIPGLPIHARWVYEMSHVFADTAQTDMQQYYLYVPRHFFRIQFALGATYMEEELWINDAGFLASHTVESTRAFAERLLGGFANMQDAKLMKADIKNAYGDAAKYQVAYVYENDPGLTFTVDLLSLLQFQNATVLHKPVRESGVNPDHELIDPYKISQDANGYIKSEPAGPTVGYTSYLTRMPITAEGIDKMSAPQRNILAVEATRLMQMPDIRRSSDGDDRWVLNGPTASVADRVYMVGIFPAVSTSETRLYDFNIEVAAIDDTSVSISNNKLTLGEYYLLCAANSFDWFPKRFLSAEVSYSPELTARSVQPLFAWDQALTIDKQQLKHMNKTIALHLFGGDADSAKRG